MLGMIFGVAAVLSMLSIGAGAQQQVMAFIEGLGVRNIIVEARETTDWQAYQKIRLQSPGLTFQDLRAIQAAVPGIEAITPRKRFTPTQVVPKPTGEMPVVFGVEPDYSRSAALRVGVGPLLRRRRSRARRGGVRPRRGGADGPVRRHRSTGPVRQDRRAMVPGHRHCRTAGGGSRSDVGGVPAQDRNNLIYVPTCGGDPAAGGQLPQIRDEIDGLYVRVASDADISRRPRSMRGMLDASHRGATDYS